MWQPYLSRGLRWVYLKSNLRHLSPDCGPKPDSTLDYDALVVYGRLKYYRWFKATCVTTGMFRSQTMEGLLQRRVVPPSCILLPRRSFSCHSFVLSARMPFRRNYCYYIDKCY